MVEHTYVRDFGSWLLSLAWVHKTEHTELLIKKKHRNSKVRIIKTEAIQNMNMKLTHRLHWTLLLLLTPRTITAQFHDVNANKVSTHLVNIYQVVVDVLRVFSQTQLIT